MEFKVNAHQFKEVMKTFALILNPECALYVKASSDDHISVESGGRGIYIKALIEAEVNSHGEAGVGCDRFSNIRLKKGDTLHVKASDREMKFSSGSLQGKLMCKPTEEDIVNMRPVEEFPAKIRVAADHLRHAVSSSTFVGALPTSRNGIRIQAADKLKVSTTDQYRATLFREDLAFTPVGEIDVLLNPGFIQTALARIKTPELSLGLHNGTFQISSEVLTIYYPTIQMEPQDIEGWIDSGIDPEECRCTVKTTAEDFIQVIDEASSIRTGALGFDIHFDLLIKGTKMVSRVSTPHGDALSSIDLVESDSEKHVTKLSSRYMLEMLNLIKKGPITVKFWDNYLTISALDGTYTSVVPTIAQVGK